MNCDIVQFLNFYSKIKIARKEYVMKLTSVDISGYERQGLLDYPGKCSFIKWG